MMVPVAPHSGENFAVHYGYKDFFTYIENLPEIVFADDVARVIDHMWVTNTNYTLTYYYKHAADDTANNCYCFIRGGDGSINAKDIASAYMNGGKLDEWKKIVESIKTAEPEVTIGIVGKYVELEDSYISIRESLLHGAADVGVNLKIEYISSDVDNLDETVLNGLDGILITVPIAI